MQGVQTTDSGTAANRLGSMLPAVPQPALAALEWAYGSCGLAQVELSGHAFGLQWLCPPSQARCSWQVELSTTLGSFLLALDAQDVFEFWPSPSPELPHEVLAIHLAEEFAPLIEWFEGTFEAEVLDLNLGARCTVQPLLSLAVQRLDQPRPVLVHFTQWPAGWQAQRMADNPFGQPGAYAGFELLPVRLTGLIGASSIRLSELRQLESGDIVAIERWVTQGDHLRVDYRIESARTPRILAWAGSLHTTVSDIQHEAELMQPTPHLVAGLDQRNLDDLEVNVQFDLGERALPLHELQAIRPGYVFALQDALNKATVRLTVNGAVLGHGQLVALGERLGVRITALGREGAGERDS